MTITPRDDNGFLTADEGAAAARLLARTRTKLTDDEHVRHLQDMHVSEHKRDAAGHDADVFSPFQTPTTREGRLCGHWSPAPDTPPLPPAERPAEF